MMLLEDRGKALFREVGVPVPRGRTVSAKDGAVDTPLPVVVKALVPSGGRGKAGGVALARTSGELTAALDRIIGMTISDHRVEEVLVEEALDISREMYISILVDRSRGIPVLIVRDRGGVDVESLPKSSVHRWPVHPFIGVTSFTARKATTALGIKGRELELEALLKDLWRLFGSKDCELVEINPLVLTADGRLVAADSKVVINDDAMYRHPELVDDRFGASGLEEDARKVGATYVGLEGDIGVVANGAGLTMATLDELALLGGRAGGFMDLGGTDDPAKVEGAVSIMSRSGQRVLLVNIFGGITRCDVVAEGLLRAIDRTKMSIPVVARIRGVNEGEAREMLMRGGIAAHYDLTEAVEAAVRLGGSR